MIATILQPKEKIPSTKMLKGLCLLGGRYWIRTSDPLLVRHVHITEFLRFITSFTSKFHNVAFSENEDLPVFGHCNFRQIS